MQNFKANMTTLASVLTPELLKSIGATQVKMVSPRTARIDCAPRADGTNQIKVTVGDDGLLLQGFKLEATDIAYGVSPSNIALALANLGQEPQTGGPDALAAFTNLTK
jgi:hypothetical protein